MPLFDFLFQILVRGRHHAHVDLNGFLRAHRLEALLFKDAQYLRLGPQAHVADFVEEQRAAIGLLEFAHLAFMREREAALHMAEQLAFDQAFGNRRAVHFHERLCRPRAQ